MTKENLSFLIETKIKDLYKEFHMIQKTEIPDILVKKERIKTKIKALESTKRLNNYMNSELITSVLKELEVL